MSALTHPVPGADPTKGLQKRGASSIGDLESANSADRNRLPGTMNKMSVDQCPHLEEFKAHSLKTFGKVHAIFVVSADECSREIKLKNSVCHVCKSRGPKLHACLHCIFFGCWPHIRDHTMREKHCFSIELSYGQLYCTKCSDYVYDKKLDELTTANKLQAVKCNKKLLDSVSLNKYANDEIDWTGICLTPNSAIGLLNLGDTCFINCIVQVLLHTPVLREYFLSDRHKCHSNLTSCLVCEFSRLFQECYRGQNLPLALDRLLYLIWTRHEELCGYKQQDAHEFLMATLHLLHSDCCDSLPSSSVSNDIYCKCIIDQIFTGCIQSDVVCQDCNGVSRTVELMRDFPLDLDCHHTLVECLEQYTRLENLGCNDEDKIMCSTCGTKRESTKQVSVATLPIVIIFQLKRLQVKKNPPHISFPEMLDMAPFISRNKNEVVNILPPDNRYSLYGVVNHKGSAEIGHYTSFVRQQKDYWYNCNDSSIAGAKLTEVLESQAYLLFYHKHVLNYD